MYFTTGTYFVFLMAVFFGYWALAGRPRWRLAFLAAASCFFYSLMGVRGLLLLVAVSLVDFTTTTLMAGAEAHRRRKLLFISLAVDIGTLCAFKYAGFFIETSAGALSILGVTLPFPAFEIVAPAGISFFIFQSTAYVIDVYRKDTEPAGSYLDYLAFLSFFPTIVAGPILRARQLLPHLRRAVALDASSGGAALFLIAIGLIKKIAIADYLSANLVDRVFDFPERFSSLEVLAAIYGYAVQIYADFSGYSDIAIGSAMLLGFTLPVNFNAPYRSRDLPEFWRRWHISLSTWLRDYLFFTIAGSRRRNWVSLYCGVIVTMLIGGLWHGASSTFVMWGLLHGVGLAGVRVLDGLRRRHGWARGSSPWSNALGVVITFHFVCFTWIFFRADTIDRAAAVIRRLFSLTSLTADLSNLTPPVALVMALGFVAHWFPDRLYDGAANGFIKLPSLAQACVLFALAVGLYFVASSDIAPFIYSRF
jgi:alginate O-acetyltransferase complex protein AlgI